MKKKLVFILIILFLLFFPIVKYDNMKIGVMYIPEYNLVIFDSMGSVLLSWDRYRRCVGISEPEIPDYSESEIVTAIWGWGGEDIKLTYACEKTHWFQDFRIGFFPGRSRYCDFPNHYCWMPNSGLWYYFEWYRSNPKVLGEIYKFYIPNIFISFRQHFNGERYIGIVYNKSEPNFWYGSLEHFTSKGIWFNELHDVQCTSFFLHCDCYEEISNVK